MKKRIAVLLSAAMILAVFAGCGGEKSPAQDQTQAPGQDQTQTPTQSEAQTVELSAFANVQWVRSTSNDTEFIAFPGDGSFSYYCGCGNPVEDSDLCDGYSYDPATRTICLSYDGQIRQVLVVACTEEQLVLDFDGDVRTFTKEYPGDTEYVPAETVTFEGHTYCLLQYKTDIFYYCLQKEIVPSDEEESTDPLPHEKWDMVCRMGDVYVREDMVLQAQAYYQNDANYTWSVFVDEVSWDEAIVEPVSVTDEELADVYALEDLEKDKTLAFEDIQAFAALNKTSLDGLIGASIQLAYYEGVWYWRSEVIDDSQEGWPEYVYPLPASLGEKISAVAQNLPR